MKRQFVECTAQLEVPNDVSCIFRQHMTILFPAPCGARGGGHILLKNIIIKACLNF